MINMSFLLYNSYLFFNITKPLDENEIIKED